jgi:UDP-glucose 4-epimerase
MAVYGITGVSGYIGTRLCELLAARPDVERIVGLDVKPPPRPTPKLDFRQQDVARPFDDAFEGVDVAIHLAWILNPVHDAAFMTAVNLGGTRHFLRACERAAVRRVVAASSATAYGAQPDNPVPLPERWPVRPDQAYQYAREKAVMEGMIQVWARFRPAVEVVIARPCIVIGPNVDNFISRMLLKPVVPMIRGEDPPMQFVHEEDVVRAFAAMARGGPAGTFNIAGDGLLHQSAIVRRFGGRVVYVPERAVEALAWTGWKLNVRRLVEAPPSLVPFMRFPWAVDNRLFKDSFGFSYTYDTVAALDALRASRTPGRISWRTDPV